MSETVSRPARGPEEPDRRGRPGPRAQLGLRGVVNGTTAGTRYDQLAVVAHQVGLGGATWQATWGLTQAPGDQITITNNTGDPVTKPIVGTFKTRDCCGPLSVKLM